jgi:CBS domain-containing protein
MQLPLAGDDDPGMVNAESRQELPVVFDDATVEDAMSHGVISCSPETPLRVVARMMATYGVHAIFVFEHTDEDDEAPQLWAVVSDLDLVAAGLGPRETFASA